MSSPGDAFLQSRSDHRRRRGIGLTTPIRNSSWCGHRDLFRRRRAAARIFHAKSRPSNWNTRSAADRVDRARRRPQLSAAAPRSTQQDHPTSLPPMWCARSHPIRAAPGAVRLGAPKVTWAQLNESTCLSCAASSALRCRRARSSARAASPRRAKDVSRGTLETRPVGSRRPGPRDRRPRRSGQQSHLAWMEMPRTEPRSKVKPVPAPTLVPGSGRDGKTVLERRAGEPRRTPPATWRWAPTPKRRQWPRRRSICARAASCVRGLRQRATPGCA